MTPREKQFWDAAMALKEGGNRLLTEEIIARMKEDFRQILEKQESERNVRI